MRDRDLPGTGLRITEIGFGAASLGNLYTPISDEQAEDAVDAAWRQGIRYFDTAPHYGLGLSERRLGRALAKYPRDEYVLSTKVGRILVPRVPPRARDGDLFAVPGTLRREWDFTPGGIRRSLEDSLERLGLDRVDLLLLHDPDVSPVDGAAALGALALTSLREEGLARAVGIGSNSVATVSEALRKTDLDTAMLAGRYTLLEHDSVDVFEAAGSRAIIAAGVFNSGLLATPEPTADARFNYSAVSTDVLERARSLAQSAAASGTTLPAAAIAFPLRNRQVASTVLGMGTAEQVTANIAAYRTPPPEAFWRNRPWAVTQ